MSEDPTETLKLIAACIWPGQMISGVDTNAARVQASIMDILTSRGYGPRAPSKRTISRAHFHTLLDRSLDECKVGSSFVGTFVDLVLASKVKP